MAIMRHLVVVRGDIAGKSEKPRKLLLLRYWHLESRRASRPHKLAAAIGGYAEAGCFGAVPQACVIAGGQAHCQNFVAGILAAFPAEPWRLAPRRGAGRHIGW